jgi:hypothetical protein
LINTKTQILFQLISQHRNRILSVLVGDRISFQVFSSNREVHHNGIKITARNTQNGKRKQHVWEREELHRKFWWEKLTEEHLEDLRVGGKITLKWVFTEWNGNMDCVNLAQNRDRCRAPVNAVISFRVLKK